MKLTQILKKILTEDLGDKMMLSDATADMFIIPGKENEPLYVPSINYNVSGEAMIPKSNEQEIIRFDINPSKRDFYFNRFKKAWLDAFGDMEFELFTKYGRRNFMPVNFDLEPVDLSSEYSGPPGSYTGD